MSTGPIVIQRRSQRWSRTRLQATDHYIDWIIAAGLFLLSFVGNVGIFGIDVQRLVSFSAWRTSWLSFVLALGSAAVMQYIVQRRQWANCHEKWGWRYRTALLASVTPSVITYWPLVVPPLRRAIIASVPSPVASVVLTIVLIAMIVGIDVAQEEILVER